MGVVAILLQSSAYRIRASATDDDIRAVEIFFSLPLPEDLKTILRFSNGFDAMVGSVDLQLWSTVDIIDLNPAYGFEKYLPGFLAIGSDSNGYAICLDYREKRETPPVISVQFGDLDVIAIQNLTDSVTDLVLAASIGAITRDDIQGFTYEY